MRSITNDQRKPPKNKDSKKGAHIDRDIGDALRQAYDEAVHESIPDDLLDLLKKLD